LTGSLQTPKVIVQYLDQLDAIPSDSDISGCEDDSEDDETWLPRVDRIAPHSDDDDDDQEDLALPGDGEGDGGDQFQPDPEDTGLLPVPPLLVGRAGNGRPSARKKRKVKEPTIWEKKDLPPQQMPQNTVKPKGVQDCKLDVHYFLKLFGMNNFNLLTYHTNLVRVKIAIERNRPIPAFSEQEIRQVIGILLYMSVVRLPSIKLYWRKSLRNSMVADVMFRDRFQLILSCLHLSDNNLQPKAEDPDYDRLYKIREFISNIAVNFKNHAEIEEVTSVDEQIIPFKGQLGLKVYMQDKPSPWGVKVNKVFYLRNLFCLKRIYFAEVGMQTFFISPQIFICNHNFYL
jgi:hypothetical protein